MATITTISEAVGANRIVPTVAIPYPVGNPDLGEREEAIREDLVKLAVDALGTAISKPTIFKLLK